jgi:hypothetical protein
MGVNFVGGRFVIGDWFSRREGSLVVLNGHRDRSFRPQIKEVFA